MLQSTDKEVNMDIKEIQKFIETDYLAWNKHFVHQDKKTEAFVIMLKIAEETGKLAREVTRSFGFANQRHLDMPSKLDDKLASVLINTVLIARCLDIDVPAALNRKMEMIRERLKNGGKDECKDTLCHDMGCGFKKNK